MSSRRRDKRRTRRALISAELKRRLEPHAVLLGFRLEAMQNLYAIRSCIGNPGMPVGDAINASEPVGALRKLYELWERDNATR